MVDTCIVRRIEEDTKNYSETIGRNYGWDFNVYPSDRRVGCGYVFDSSKISIEDAKKEYMENNGHRKFLTDFRVLKWEPGRLKTPWQGDTVAVGLSAGFIEPNGGKWTKFTTANDKNIILILGKSKQIKYIIKQAPKCLTRC